MSPDLARRIVCTTVIPIIGDRDAVRSKGVGRARVEVGNCLPIEVHDFLLDKCFWIGLPWVRFAAPRLLRVSRHAAAALMSLVH